MIVKPVIGWREWVSLPDLGVGLVKAKVDTGARSSSLHAWNIRVVDSSSGPVLHFEVHPLQRDDQHAVACRSRHFEFRTIRSSIGKTQLRPVIRTALCFGDETLEIELTLASRDDMGFRMLLGREAIRGRFVVDPGRSFMMKHPALKQKRTRVRRLAPSDKGKLR